MYSTKRRTSTGCIQPVVQAGRRVQEAANDQSDQKEGDLDKSTDGAGEPLAQSSLQKMTLKM